MLVVVGLENVGFDETEVNAAVWVSADGIAWEQVPMPHAPDVFGAQSWMAAVAARDDRVVAMGNHFWGGPMVWISPPRP